MLCLIKGSLPIMFTSYVKNENKSTIKKMWEQVFPLSNAEEGLFLSWHWMEQVLASYSGDYFFLLTLEARKPVGVCIVFLQRENAKLVGYLNKTGVSSFDQTWLEYNDFVVAAFDERAIKLNMLECCYHELGLDELVVGASLKESLAPFGLLFTKKRVEWQSQTYQIDLRNYSNKQSFLSSLSSNSRYQIQRAEREYQTFGGKKIKRAESVEEALSWFDEMAPHHIKRWRNTRVGSGFENPRFVTFHKNLIQKCFHLNQIDILKVSYGNHPVAYLYNFVVKKRVYFYLSANVYTYNSKHSKPGLVAHTLAVEYYITRDILLYDLMGGDSQYKRSIASQGQPISIVRFQRSNLRMFIEHKAREIKQRFFSSNEEGFNGKKQLLITGGRLNEENRTPTYVEARAIKIEISPKRDASIVSSLSYTPTKIKDVQTESTNIIFKSASLNGHLMYVPTETEIKVVDINNMEIVDSYSMACFNDLHHVIKKGQHLFVANTGLDVVTQIDLKTEHVKHHSTFRSREMRPFSGIDCRQKVSTKPHITHPNFCFVVNDEIWVTRCDLMDAISLNNPEKRLFIGDGLVHDGVEFGKYIYFTTVNGHIKVFDSHTLKLHCDLDITTISSQHNGWFRGVCPINQGTVLIAMSKSRSSKRLTVGNNHSQLLLIDLYKKSIIQVWSLAEMKLDAVFSVIGVPNQ